jgi:hypothetical protein
MGGFLSSYKRWPKFDKRREAVLNPDAGKRVFHASAKMDTVISSD